jgi:hypothetical protein
MGTEAQATDRVSWWRYVWDIVSLYHLDPAITPSNRCKRCGCKVRL